MDAIIAHLNAIHPKYTFTSKEVFRCISKITNLVRDKFSLPDFSFASSSLMCNHTFDQYVDIILYVRSLSRASLNNTDIHLAICAGKFISPLITMKAPFDRALLESTFMKREECDPICWIQRHPIMPLNFKSGVKSNKAMMNKIIRHARSKSWIIAKDVTPANFQQQRRYVLMDTELRIFAHTEYLSLGNATLTGNDVAFVWDFPDYFVFVPPAYSEMNQKSFTAPSKKFYALVMLIKIYHNFDYISIPWHYDGKHRNCGVFRNIAFV